MEQINQKLNNELLEEKERYELIGYCNYRDTETGVIGDNFVGVLNEQDAKIKELEDMVIDKQNKLYSRLDKIKELQEENQQLKQQLHSQPVEILDKVYKYLTDEHNWKKLKNSWLVNGECEYLKIILKSILKEYGGKDE